MIFRAGFTGTRNGMTAAQEQKLRNALAVFGYFDLRGEFHHGDCVGSDATAHDVAAQIGFEPVLHPPKNPRYRAWKPARRILEPADYLVRNRAIVDQTHMLIATPSGAVEELRSGTWSTIRYARQLGRWTYVIAPDGSRIEQPAMSCFAPTCYCDRDSSRSRARCGNWRTAK